VLVEGGGEVHASFLEAGVVDRVTLFVAPLLLGGRTAPAVVGGAGRDLKSAIRLGPLTARAVGDDLLIEADVLHDADGSSPDRRGGGADVAADHGPPDRRGGK
jgi:diaminohydroxyphosphoribosylaminopyrimidine deaminase/5-amino-6-(5-phosphoribosylamino)uracil reductase